MNVYDEFKWRDLIYDNTEGIEKILSKEKVSAYIGFDASAASLHAGNLIPIMGLVRMQQYGHTPIPVVGGGTSLIGDPGGKSTERPLLSKEEIAFNAEGIRAQLGRFLDFDNKKNPAIMVNNADWLCEINLTDFLRDIGKHFSISSMLAKESVSARLESVGISFTEFSYMLLQSYDYLNLYEKYNCILQMGASDQWGNITAGVDLIRRIHGAKAHALVFPLLTNSSGSKYGKSESGAVWLDANLTSPYRFYQFWINTEDNEVITCLKSFTLMTQPEIEELAEAVKSEPEKREAQKKLAQDVTRRVHGDEAFKKAEYASRVLFGEEIGNLSLTDLMDIFSEAPSVRMNISGFQQKGMALIDLATSSGLVKSKGEARRLIEGGGIYLQNVRITDTKRAVSIEHAIEGQVFILRKGQKEYRLVIVSED
ncbi:tyrosine--tRNA ligase [Chloroflexota bacterium]